MQCGQNLTLLCHVILPDRGDMKLFSWVFNNTTCKYGESHADSEFVCQSGDLTSQYTLDLTLLNLMPDDQGEYVCKVRSKAGVESITVNVTVQGVCIFPPLAYLKKKSIIIHLAKESLIPADCFEPSDFTMNDTHTTCCFSGIYPNGIIHWFQEDVYLTDFAGPQEETEDQHGRYDACSTLDIHKGNVSQLYTCSLWSPESEKYLFSQTKRYIPVQELSKGSTINLPIVTIMSVITLTHLTF